MEAKKTAEQIRYEEAKEFLIRCASCYFEKTNFSVDSSLGKQIIRTMIRFASQDRWISVDKMDASHEGKQLLFWNKYSHLPETDTMIRESYSHFQVIQPPTK